MVLPLCGLCVLSICIFSMTRNFAHRKAIPGCASMFCNFYFVLHPVAQKAISGNYGWLRSQHGHWMKSQTDNMSVLIRTNWWCDRERRFSRVCHGISTHTAWGNSKLSHPGGQTKCGCKAVSTHTYTPCLPADCGHCRSLPGPQAMGGWLAGKWLLCLQHGRRIQAHTVLDLKLPELHKFKPIVLPIKSNQETWLLFSNTTKALHMQTDLSIDKIQNIKFPSIIKHGQRQLCDNGMAT